MAKHELASGRQKTSKKTTITLSIDTDILNSIKQDAEAKGLSINYRINAVLEKYEKFYKYMEMLESCIIPYNQFVKMLNLMDEEGLKNILANDGNSHAISALKQNRLPLTIDTLVEHIFKTGALYSGAYTSFHHYSDSGRGLCLVFDHKFGLKWARIIAASFARLIEMAVHLQAETEVLPYTVTIRLVN